MSASKYKQAGVDIEAGQTLVDNIKRFANARRTDGVSSDIGGYGGVFEPKAAGFKDPLLVSTCDGVGTKLRLAITTQKHDTIGIDLVAMCVNDLIVQGAKPLFLLDYVATGRLDIGIVREIIAGVAAGCKLAGCTLLGGETAEMPGLYQLEDYDLAGFAVGAVERENLITGQDITPDDVIIGIGSSGAHSNGFSLIRKVVADQDLEYDSPAPFMLDIPLGEALLAPTKIYIKTLLPLIEKKLIKGMAHITGGGLTDNLPRILPNAVTAEIDLQSWRLPPVFRWIADKGDVSIPEMLKTFNCGIGMALVIPKNKVGEVEKRLKEVGEEAYQIGKIIPRKESCTGITYQGMTDRWLA